MKVEGKLELLAEEDVGPLLEMKPILKRIRE